MLFEQLLTANFDSLAVPGYYPLSTSGPATATPDGFLAKFSPNGHLRWVRTTIGPEGESGGRVSVAPNSDCLVAGTAYANTIGAPGVSYVGGIQHLARYSPAGAARWVRPLGAVGQGAIVNGLVATADGGYLAGFFGGVGTYATLSLRPGDTLRIGGPFGAANGLVARFDTSGRVEWAQPLHSISRVRAIGLALVPGGVAIAGRFYFNNYSPQSAFLTAPGYSFPVRGESDGFVATYDSAGGLHSLQVISGSAQDKVNACCYNPATHELIAAGYFRDTLGTRSDHSGYVVSAGLEDGFLMGIPLGRITGLPALPVATPTLAVWPNPAHTWLRVAVNGADPRAPLLLYDALGRVVRRAPAGAAGVSVAGLAPGVYQVAVDAPRPLRRVVLVE